MTEPNAPRAAWRSSWRRLRSIRHYRFVGVPVGSWIWLGLGFAALAFAFAGSDLSAIADALKLLGWSFILLLVLRLGSIALSALGWYQLFDGPRPKPFFLMLVRWIGEAINTLLPVAQVGGEIVRVRLPLLATKDLSLSPISASVIVDMSIALLAQLTVVTVVGLYLATRGIIGFGGAVLLVVATALPLVAFVAGQKYGLIRGLDALMQRTSADHSTGALRSATALLYRNPLALGRALAWHLGGWALRACEPWAAANLMGWPLSFAEAMALEGLIGAARTIGFFVPGGLGIQEFSLIGVSAWLGVGGAPVLALAAVKRGREIVLGLIGLALWPLLEGKQGQR